MSNSVSQASSQAIFDAPFMGGGKAAGLLRIHGIPGIKVPAFTYFTADATAAEQAEITKSFIAQHSSPTAAFTHVAVRSSALNEDGEFASLAGAFKTVLNVPIETSAILAATQDVQTHGQSKLLEVFNSSAPAMGIVVQRMIDEPDVAGVCLSQGFGADDAAYLLINFKQGLGDGLVSGATAGHQLRVLRSDVYNEAVNARFPFLQPLVDSLQKVEANYEGKPVDIEFAYKDGELYVLQSRHLIAKHEAQPAQRATMLAAAVAADQKIMSDVKGDVLCDMSDINPRELLGGNAKPVNISIFRQMFADKSVEAARAEMGYAPLHIGLLREVEGKPYISLHASAHSVRPAQISLPTYEKLVDVYKEQVAANPDLQDKVEFAVYLTNARQVPEFMQKHGARFTPAEQHEITQGLMQFDDQLGSRINTYCNGYDATMQAYKAKTARLEGASLAQTLAVLQEGTTLFVKTARLAFYKKAYYDNVYGPEATASSLMGLDTPSERLRHDLLDYARGSMSEQELRREYGHLRPGQMDIFAPAYRSDIARNLNLASYAGMNAADIAAQAPATIRPPLHEDEAELRLLFAARENVKHEFMRAYDHLAGLVLQQGKALGLRSEQIAALSLDDYLALEQDPSRKAEMQAKAKSPQNSNRLLLPSVLTPETDLRCLEVDTKKGTFFTNKVVEAMPLIVTDDNLQQLTADNVRGKILIMDHADPGYDFLLLYKPAGVITKIGGPASHIAIRVNEISLPACIGSGIDPASVDCSKTYILDCQRQQHYEGKAPVAQTVLKRSVDAVHSP